MSDKKKSDEASELSSSKRRSSDLTTRRLSEKFKEQIEKDTVQRSSITETNSTVLPIRPIKVKPAYAGTEDDDKSVLEEAFSSQKKSVRLSLDDKKKIPGNSSQETFKSGNINAKQEESSFHLTRVQKSSHLDKLGSSK